MSTDEERVMRAMEDAHRGDTAGRRLGYNHATRRIVPIDDRGQPIGQDPDRITAVTLKVMEHFLGRGREAR